MNTFKRRALIFVTFFGSCLALSLLAASLATNHWITAACKRTENAEKSNGTVNFGLFEYETNLNVGYGDRYTVMNMLGELIFLHISFSELIQEGIKQMLSLVSIIILRRVLYFRICFVLLINRMNMEVHLK